MSTFRLGNEVSTGLYYSKSEPRHFYFEAITMANIQTFNPTPLRPMMMGTPIPLGMMPLSTPIPLGLNPISALSTNPMFMGTPSTQTSSSNNLDLGSDSALPRAQSLLTQLRIALNTLSPTDSRYGKFKAAGDNLNNLVQVKILNLLARDAFSDTPTGKIPNGYRRLDDNQLMSLGLDPAKLINPNTGLGSAVYQTPEGKFVLAFRGADKLLVDAVMAINSVLGLNSPQYTDANDIAKTLVERVGSQNVEVVGNSLGGGLANYVALKYNLKSTTFNPKGTTFKERNEIPDMDSKADKLITNYHVAGDILTTIQETDFFEKTLVQILGENGQTLGANLDKVTLGAPGKHYTLPAIIETNNNTTPVEGIITDQLAQLQLSAPLKEAIARHRESYVNGGVNALLNLQSQLVEQLLRGA